MPSIDLNSDLGESFGCYTIGADERILPLVSSCNIACGMHAGDPVVMEKTVGLAAAAGCSIGAHPGYPDLQGFGRRDMALSPAEVRSTLIYQVGALAAFCRARGVTLAHVKPHGQLYNRAARDPEVARAIAGAVADFDAGLVLVGLAGSELVRAGQEAGLRVAGEFFADRAYRADGTLVPRSQPGAVLHDPRDAVERLVEVIRTGIVPAIDGTPVEVKADTVCVHGDNAEALAFVGLIREALAREGIQVAAPARG